MRRWVVTGALLVIVTAVVVMLGLSRAPSQPSAEERQDFLARFVDDWEGLCAQLQYGDWYRTADGTGTDVATFLDDVDAAATRSGKQAEWKQTQQDIHMRRCIYRRSDGAIGTDPDASTAPPEGHPGTSR